MPASTAGGFEPAYAVPVPPDTLADTTQAVTVLDETRWGTYTIRCETCGRSAGLTYLVATMSAVRGEWAWLRCPLGHEHDHCLVYPELVHAVIAWSSAPNVPPSLPDRFATISWGPHWAQWTESSDPDVMPFVQWQEWRFMQWRSAKRYSPDIVAARESMAAR